MPVSNTVAKITRNSARKNAAQKRAKHLKNVQARAGLYAKFQGEIRNDSDMLEWHTTLHNLSRGLAT